MKMCKEDIITIIKSCIFGVIGVGLSVLFIFLYEKYDNLIITIHTAIISLIYMVVTLVVIDKEVMIFNRLALVITPIFYTVILFALFCLFGKSAMADNPIMVLHFFLWSVYLMPSFIVVFLVGLLLIFMLSYA